MDYLAIISVICLSMGSMLILAWYFLSTFIKIEKNKDENNNKLEWQKVSIPIRLQAYERMILFLERISFEQLILRNMKSGQTAKQLHYELLKNIRDEFSHNLSQQLYISDSAWELIKTAKEDIIQTINSISSNLPNEANAQDFAQKLLEVSVDKNYSLLEKAKDYLKEEARKMF